ncbi:hypothetical protein D3H55_16980 [Bacillus salacetis]|uniref:Uncharacterized protein n=1 Tax=Bacillus salacetis TaxID=2315464 RepID=A0A3A1QT75_9BACI|nr:hypothetical protein [Bacillus salacetis]RIW30428.1 hypothetical protein D3H55_16980 [Bacillus salacetis]
MEPKEDEITKAIGDLIKRMDRLEESLKQNKGVHLQIQHVDTLTLENLNYHLDHVDIKELSGMLNIGNTFKQKENKQKSKVPRVKKGSSAADNDISILINGKDVPYCLENGEEEETDFPLPNSTEFSIGDIHIGTVEDASAVNFGNNFPTNFRSNKKHNQGLGNIIGNNNDIHDLKSLMKERNAGGVYNENSNDQPPERLNIIEKEEEESQGPNTPPAGI